MHTPFDMLETRPGKYRTTRHALCTLNKRQATKAKEAIVDLFNFFVTMYVCVCVFHSVPNYRSLLIL